MADLLTPEEIAHIRLCAQSYVYEPAREPVGPQAINQMAQRVMELLNHIDTLNASIPARERAAFKLGTLWCQGWTCSDPPPPRIYDEAVRRYPDPVAARPAPEAAP